MNGKSGGISGPFIRRPIGTALLMAALLLAGGLAYVSLPVAALPRIDFPTVNVSATLPGASPETTAAAVAAPLERRLGQIAGVSEMTSVSGVGAASITVQFALDRDIDSAVRDVQAAITAARGELPAGMPNPPTWRKANPADAPVLILAMTSRTLAPGKLYEAASTILAQRIAQVEGVAQVTINGAEKSAVRVQANPSALASMGLGLEDVRALAVAANAHGPKGRVDGETQAYTIGDDDQLLGAEAFRPLVLRAANGAVVRLDAVASVIDGVANTRLAAWFNGDRAVLISIQKQPNANVIETVERVKALLPKLERWMPPAVDLKVLSDRTATIRASVRDVQFTLLLTVALVVSIVFVFLRRLWSTFAAALTVPLSLAGTFTGMYFCGYSLDNLSLMALTVAVGFVVDDAIVMIENVSRRREAGDAPLQAALAGARQIGFTVVSISVSLIAVFIPLLFMGGIVGRLFHEFAVTMSMAIAVSALVSLTATPMVCAYLARPGAPGPETPRNFLERFSERAFDAMLDLYARGLDLALRFRRTVLLLAAGTLALTVCLYIAVPKGFFPQQDTGRLSGTTEAPPDVSFQEMLRRHRAVAEVILQNPDVAGMGSFIGASGFNPQVNLGRFFIDLRPIGERRRTVDEVIAALRKAAASVDGIRLYLNPVQDLQVGGRISKSQYQYTLSSANPEDLAAFAPRLLARLQTNPMLQGVATDQQAGGLEVRLDVDRDAAARTGLTMQDVDAALGDAFGQKQIAIMYTERDQFRVVVEVDPALQQDPAALDRVFVKSARDGRQVPLGSIARWTRGTTTLAINHQGQFPAATISFGLSPGVSLGQAEDWIQTATRELGPPASLRASFQGNAQAFQDSLASQPWLIATAVVAIYIILGVLYESLVHPLTILSTIPSAGVGAILSLMGFGYALDVIGLIGIILLIGIVKKNAIMMIDFALEAERDRGLDAAAAIREACLLRFRPILMTTLAALLGALPLAMGHGAGSELRRPLGIAICGGLLASQALTLFTTPVLYVTLDRLRRRQCLTPAPVI